MTELMNDTMQLDEVESELQDIGMWLSEVRSTNARLMEKLRRLNATISGNDRSIPHTPPRGTAPVDVLYRLNHTAKASRYHKALGVLRPGWSPPHAEPLPVNAESFHKHFTQEDRAPSPFISVTDTPGRIINVSKSDGCVGHELEVLVINPKIVHQFGIRCQRSTKWAQDLGVSSRISAAIDSHWLVERWIPKKCIKAVVKFKDFEGLCKVKHIISGEFRLEI